MDMSYRALTARGIWWGLILLLVGLLLSPASVLVVRLETGELAAFFPAFLWGGLSLTEPRFSLSYVHSLYDQPAEEIFRLERGGGFSLAAIRSQSLAVLEYYDLGPAHSLPGTRLWEINVTGQAVAELSILADRTGQRTLHWAGRVIPLHRFGEGAHLTLKTENWPLGRLFWLAVSCQAAGREPWLSPLSSP